MLKAEEDLPGFELHPKKNLEQNVNLSSKKKKSGGFQSMGLSFPVLKGISKRGYKQPTPIQRKTIPLVLEGKDVVAMARTGSGKTACFVLPILENLIAPSNKNTHGKNLRALILSPTRELALQIQLVHTIVLLDIASLQASESATYSASVLDKAVTLLPTLP
ncbi:ATP-dependent RNA helicase DDX54 [Eumeta japonica]|uniref:RNA helicase n=1 Tax=Eumeta variegata TaxID=151549 RepID=A0A4C1TTY3_EUMVA|nr:ATP-dependent RNA helicase DDX54 [Eumeta japonica]